MPARATRERQKRFIRDFGPGADKAAVMRLFDRYGLDMLTDEQMAETVSMQVADWRFRERLNRANRAIYAARKTA
jgi:hypothetical protein